MSKRVVVAESGREVRIVRRPAREVIAYAITHAPPGVKGGPYEAPAKSGPAGTPWPTLATAFRGAGHSWVADIAADARDAGAKHARVIRIVRKARPFKETIPVCRTCGYDAHGGRDVSRNDEHLVTAHEVLDKLARLTAPAEGEPTDVESHGVWMDGWVGTDAVASRRPLFRAGVAHERARHGPCALDPRMSIEAVDAEIRAAGGDPEAIAARGLAFVRGLQARHATPVSSRAGGGSRVSLARGAKGRSRARRCVTAHGPPSGHSRRPAYSWRRP